MTSAARKWVRADSAEAMEYRGEIHGRIRGEAVDPRYQHPPAQGNEYEVYDPHERHEEHDDVHKSGWPIAIFFCFVFSALMWAGVVFGDGEGQWGANKVRQTIVPLPKP